jgi:hypothetical protein
MIRQTNTIRNGKLALGLSCALALGGCGEKVGTIEKTVKIGSYDTEISRHNISEEKLFRVSQNGETIALYIDSNGDGELEGPVGGIRETPWENTREVVQSMYDMVLGNYK